MTGEFCNLNYAISYNLNYAISYNINYAISYEYEHFPILIYVAFTVFLLCDSFFILYAFLLIAFFFNILM